jgi:prepilin-type N-terminal cleavage/methylation domain-containing protein
MNLSKFNNKKGFTLIELLVVIAIIAILAVVVFVALDPVTRFADARNSRRFNDVNNIETAIHQYIVDNDGSLPTGLTTGMAETQLGSCASGGTTSDGTTACGTAAACVNLSAPLTTYMPTLPVDPQVTTAGKTGYSVRVDANNIVTIRACNAENGETVQVSR